MPSAAAVSRTLLGLVVFLLAGTALEAQDVEARTATMADSAHCDSIPQYGWHTDTVVASVTIEPEDALPDGWEEILLSTISEHFRLPAEVNVPVRGGRVDVVDGRPVVSLAISGEVIADLDREGVLSAPLLSASTLSPEIDLSLVMAIRSLDSARILPSIPKQAKAHSVRVRYSISQDPDSGKRSRPLNIVRQPTWMLERAVAPMRGNPSPRYPLNAEDARIEGDVLISFVVDKDGKPLFETARVLGGRYRDFQVAVLEVLPRMRFYPARIAGCPIAQLVQMPFGFRIGK